MTNSSTSIKGRDKGIKPRVTKAATGTTPCIGFSSPSKSWRLDSAQITSNVTSVVIRGRIFAETTP